jgi:PBP1b-binding outer membrane lipoprotein LpoB
MKAWKPLALTTGVASLLLSGCAQISTSQALSEDNSQVAITLNQDFTNTILAVNSGERIEPCTPDPKKEQMQSQQDPSNVRPCEEINPGDVIYEKTYKVQVRKGSTCISIWVGDDRTDFCDPPYKLQF